MDDGREHGRWRCMGDGWMHDPRVDVRINVLPVDTCIVGR